MIEIPANTDILRDADGLAHIVGVSGGKDSTCLALALREREPRPYTYMYTPTGNELPEMKAHIRNLERILQARIWPVTNGTLSSVIARENMIPNFRSRFCTRILKLIPAGKLYEAAAPCVAYVGLRADEDEREGTRPGGDSAALSAPVTQDYPLQRWGWGLEEVWGFLNDREITIPERTDCAFCFWQRLGEWYNLWLYHGDIWREGEAIEEERGNTFRSPGRDSWPVSMKGLREAFEAGRVPERSLRMMEKRDGMCRVCSM